MNSHLQKVPFFNPQTPTIRDLIILALSEEWPLTARQIYSKISRQTPVEGFFEHLLAKVGVEGIKAEMMERIGRRLE